MIPACAADAERSACATGRVAMPRGEVAVGVPIHERLLALGPKEVFVGAEDAEIERVDGH